MEKHPNPFDEFLKETLKGHQLSPPEEAKKAFLKEAVTIIQTRKGFFKWYYIPVVVILLSSVIAVYYFINNQKQNTSEQLDNKQVNTAVNVNQEPIPANVTGEGSVSKTESDPGKSISSSTLITKINPENISTSNLVSSPKLTSQNNISTNPEPTPEAKVEINVVKSAATSGVSPDRGIPINSDTLAANAKSSRLNPDSLERSAVPEALPLPPNKEAGPDTTLIATPGTDVEPPGIPEVSKVNFITAGAYYLPEWMFNTVEGGKFVNNFGIEGNFYSGRISIRTGVGLSISEGTSDKSIEYNNYLGTYNKLDSITFIYNEGSHDFMPNIYTSKEKVWDSVVEFDSSSIVKRYTYLQVPLVLGFDFWQRGRLSVGVRIGTIMSVMLQSKQITGAYDPGENLVLGIQNLTPDQVSINWQAIGGFNASVALSKSFYFEFEPQAKYYYQSIYEKSGYTKKPWSIGIRAAMMYKF